MPLPLVPGLQQSSLEFVPTASGTLPGLVCPMDGLFPIRLYLGDSSGQPTSTPNGVNWQCEVDPTHNGFIPAQAQTLGTFVQAPPALIQQAEKSPFIFPVQPAPPPIVTPPITSPTPATAAAQKVAQDLAKTSSLTNLVTTALEVTNIANLTLSLAIMNQQETQQIRESVRNRLNKQDDGDILIIAQPASQVVNASFMGQPTTLPPTVGHVPGFATNPIAQGLARALGQFPGIAESQGQGGGVPTGFISIATWAGINFYTETSDPDGMVASWVQAVARDAIRAGHLEDTSGNFYRNDAIIAFGSNNNLYVTHDQFEACLFADTGPKDGPPRTTSQVQIIPAEGTFDFQYFQRLKGAALGLPIGYALGTLRTLRVISTVMTLSLLLVVTITSMLPMISLRPVYLPILAQKMAPLELPAKYKLFRQRGLLISSTSSALKEQHLGFRSDTRWAP